MLNTKEMYIDIAYNSLKKYGEELCGDKVEIFKSKERIIVVLADGLGSGVKANILATLTSKIAITMLKHGESLEEVISTILATLPVCKIREIAYSTISIIEIDSDLNCRIVESENPAFIFLRDSKVLKLKKDIITICEKQIEISNVKLEQNDLIYIFSDGVIHAGIGRLLNLGWTHKEVEKYLIKNSKASNAARLSADLTQVCNDLYGEKPGDDTTVIALKVREAVNLLVFTGPPLKKQLDKPFIKMFMKQKGKKIICGGTVANITARVLDKDIKTSIEYLDKDIPPEGKLDGIDLVTEGVITLSRVVELLNKFEKDPMSVDLKRKDAATKVFKILIEDCTNIDIWVGKAINEAHQYHDFPTELSFKINIVNDLVKGLKAIGKTAKIKYISEVDYTI